MSNDGGRRARYDQRVRFAPPTKSDLRGNLPADYRPHKPREPQIFNPGPDLSSIFKQFTYSRHTASHSGSKGEQRSDTLPIMARESEIVRAVKESDIVLIKAETGSGKSTQVPRMIHKAGFNVMILGPRRLPASELASYGAELRQEELGATIGYRHALGASVSPKTAILYETEGYQLVREIHHPTSPSWVVIFDEFHEHTANAELLLGLFKKRAEKNGAPTPKLVIMSATLDEQEISRYLGAVPIITVEGRKHEIHERTAGASIAEDAVACAREGLNPLIFLYGKKVIEQQLEESRQLGTTAKLFPLHSQLPYDAQRLAIQSHPEGKIIGSTTTAQTSLTIPDVKAVIVSGLVRRLTVDNEGVETLLIDTISRDEFQQQIGRTGRTAPGIFINHGPSPSTLRPHAPAEIQNIQLEDTALRLASGGESLQEINRYLLHPVSERQIRQAYTTLHRLGLVGPEGHITALGRRVSHLPVGCRMGKLLVRATDFRDEFGVDIISHAIDLAAVSESEGILSGESRNWRRLVPGNYSSDLLLQTRLFQKVLALPGLQLSSLGVDEVNVQRAKDVQQMLRRRMNVTATPGQGEIGESEKMWLSRAILEAYVDMVFRSNGRNSAGDQTYAPVAGGRPAVLSKDSVVGGAPLIVGSRFNIGYLDHEGTQHILPLVLMATRIDDHAWLDRHTPSVLAGVYKEELARAQQPAHRKKKDRMVSRNPRKRNR